MKTKPKIKKFKEYSEDDNKYKNAEEFFFGDDKDDDIISHITFPFTIDDREGRSKWNVNKVDINDIDAEELNNYEIITNFIKTHNDVICLKCKNTPNYAGGDFHVLYSIKTGKTLYTWDGWVAVVKGEYGLKDILEKLLNGICDEDYERE